MDKGKEFQLLEQSIKPQILILDEPTSSLDKETEDIIIRYIKKPKLKMTIIIISHTNNFETVADNVIRILRDRLTEFFK